VRIANHLSSVVDVKGKGEMEVWLVVSGKQDG
jgi:hypothetical protein